ncbi:hypothetical protein [Halocella sp. SP3-1]|uniref:hypothetical protein n=1 Tax=Halocella sp. SP3-1 TaxID=2382161 RepID=UPI0013E0D369|nr:hypothetical protein [Halocella sp. SP3-1]
MQKVYYERALYNITFACDKGQGDDGKRIDMVKKRQVENDRIKRNCDGGTGRTRIIK